MNEDCFHLGVKALIRNQKGEILLLKVNKKSLSDYKGKAYWDIPGGRVHRNAKVDETLEREVKEETGLVVRSIGPVAMVLSNIRIPLKTGDVGLILSVYDCEIDDGREVVLSDEHTEARWFGPRKASVLLRKKYPKEFTAKIQEL